MKALIVDSATNVLYVSLVIDNKVIYEVYRPSTHEHSRWALVLIEEALNQAQIEALDLDEVVVGVGPGSYTGVRIGVTIGKMLVSLGSKIKLYKISTLVLIASGSRGKVLSMIEARRNNCFGCVYDVSSGKYVVEEALHCKDDILSETYDEIVDQDHFKVDPFLVLDLAQYVEEPQLLVPNYLRATEAERNLHD